MTGKIRLIILSVWLPWALNQVKKVPKAARSGIKLHVSRNYPNPELGKGISEAIEQCRGMSAPLASSVAKLAKEPLAEVLEERVKERKQKGISGGVSQLCEEWPQQTASVLM